MGATDTILRELRGYGDLGLTLGSKAALQPVAGYNAILAALRGKDPGQAVEDVQGMGWQPRTPEAQRTLRDWGGWMEKAGNALGNPIDRLGEVSPTLGAAALGFVETADPTKSLGKAKRAASAATQAIERAALPDALRGFGEAKAAREAATAGRVAAMADEAAPAIERQKGAGTRAKVDPDVFRQRYAATAAAEGPELALESIVQSARKGEHLKPQAGGGYAGAPRTVQTGPQLGAMRRSLDDQFARGVDALQYADPERVGTWYDRAKAAQAEINEPHQLDRGLEQTAVYSAGVAPENELAFSQKHHNSRALGTPEMAYRGAGMRTLDKAVAEDRPAELAHKIGEYRNKNDPRVAETSPFGVNDFRMAQAFGYTDPQGNPWKAGVSETMHPFMDAETALAVSRANKRSAGGKADWTGATMQEIPWVLNKAEDIYGRGKQGRFAGGEPGMVAALREANNTIADYLPKHAASATYEYVPGANTAHMPQVLEMPFEQRRAYGQEGAWATPTPMDPVAAGMPASVGAGDRDALYRAALLRQQPTREAVGQYVNSTGMTENNPVYLARPLMDFQTVGEGKATAPNTVNPNTMRAVEAIEGLRGLVDAQEASAMNLPVTMGARKGKTSQLLERGTTPTAEELKAITAMLRGREDLGVTPTNRGALVMNFGDKPVPKGLEQAMPGAVPKKAAYEGAYVEGVSPAAEAGQGKATAAALERFAGAPEALARNVSESDEVRRLIREKMARDERMGGARPDIQQTRKFLSEADWSKAVDMIRKGAKPAAAVAALGYSLQGMAAEDRQRLMEAANAK